MRSASKDIKRISLELGGKSVYNFGDANLNLAIKNLIISFTFKFMSHVWVQVEYMWKKKY